MKKNITLIIICLFLLSLAVHYYPVYKKGYSFNPLGGNLILARNLALTDEYKIENEKNVILSSQKIKGEGIYCNWGNKLTPYIYSQIFKIFGFNQNLPFYISLVLWALSGIILFFIVLKLFNFKIAVIFGLLDSFIPVFTQGSLMAGFYEWAVLFFSLGLLFYLYKEKINLLNLFLAGLFFGLAALARNAFLISFIPFVIYEFWQNKSVKKVFIFVLPFILLWTAYLLPGYLNDLPNAYLSKHDTSFGQYGHLFPDPYTYHFEKDEYIQSITGIPNHSFSEYLLKYDQSVNFKNQMIMYFHSIKFYPKEFLKIIVSGGPLILLFLIMGLVYLNKKKKHLLKLFVIWSGAWYFLLVVLKSNNWDHFLELRFPMVLLISLGIYWLINFVLKLNTENKFKYLIIIIFSFFLLFHFGLSNKWMLHDEYNGSKVEIIRNLAGKINQANLDKQNDIIAINIHPTLQSLNYYTDQSIIYFDIQTINRLLKENKLDWVFEQFGVTKIIGFESELSKEIIRQTEVKIIE